MLVYVSSKKENVFPKKHFVLQLNSASELELLIIYLGNYLECLQKQEWNKGTLKI